MDEREKRLREALGAGPTPGPWWLRTNRHPNTDGTPWGWMDLYPPGTGRQASPEGVQVTWSRGRQSERNADYIAAANPESIRALLSDLDAARAECDEQARLLGMSAERELTLRAECERLRAGHSTALVALAEARAEVERLTRELDAQRVYARVLCRAVDAATDFAGTVAGGASWWDDVWAEHESALDAARSAISDAARTTGSSNA